MAHEWDWQPASPPRSRNRRTSYEDLAAPASNGWADPRVTMAVNRFWKVVWGTLGALLAVVLTVAGLGAVWLFSAAVTGFH